MEYGIWKREERREMLSKMKRAQTVRKFGKNVAKLISKIV